MRSKPSTNSKRGYPPSCGFSQTWQQPVCPQPARPLTRSAKLQRQLNNRSLGLWDSIPNISRTMASHTTRPATVTTEWTWECFSSHVAKTDPQGGNRAQTKAKHQLAPRLHDAISPATIVASRDTCRRIVMPSSVHRAALLATEVGSALQHLTVVQQILLRR